MGSAVLVSTRTAWLLLASMVVFLGVNWPVMKYGLEFIPPLHFSAARMALGGLCIGLVAAARGVLQLPKREDMPLVLGVGLMQMAAFLSLITIAVQFVPAGRSAILAYTTSLWVVPLAATFLGEKLGGLKTLGLLLGLGGVAILFNPIAFDWSDPKVLLGNGLLLLAAMIWAVLIILVRGYRGRSSPLTLAVWQFMLATAVLLPLALLLEDTGDIRPGLPLALILLYNGPIATAFCYWAMITATQALPAITTSLASLGVPVMGMVSAAIALGEPITRTNLAGLGLILGGVALVSIVDLRKAPTLAPTPTEKT